MNSPVYKFLATKIVKMYPFFNISAGGILRCSALSGTVINITHDIDGIVLSDSAFGWELHLSLDRPGGILRNDYKLREIHFYHFLFDYNIELENKDNDDMIRIKRQWQLNKIIND